MANTQLPFSQSFGHIYPAWYENEAKNQPFEQVKKPAEGYPCISWEQYGHTIDTYDSSLLNGIQSYDAQLSGGHMKPRFIAKKYYFTSADNTSTISAMLYWPLPKQGKPRGIVQILHGMSEHKRRYEPFIGMLCSKGYLCVIHDHIGHGLSAEPKNWGNLPPEAATYLVEDAHSLTQVAKKVAGTHLPYILFGHSLGSYIARAYIQRYGRELDGCILCGTGLVPLAQARAGKVAAHFIRKLRGDTYKSLFLHNKGVGVYAQAVPGDHKGLDWLSYNTTNITRYQADPACGFMFSAGAYEAVATLLLDVCSPQAFKNIPSDLPLLYIAGSEDPVGNFGKAVHECADRSLNAGVHDVNCIVYDGMRHEILNEKNNRLVYTDIVNWIAARSAS